MTAPREAKSHLALYSNYKLFFQVMDKKITLYTGQKKLFDKLSDEKLALIFRNILKELDSQEVEPISDPAADMLYTVLSAEIVPVDGRSISSKINGNKHKKRAKCVLASETQKGAISEDFDSSHNYKIKNKEVNINKGNNTQEDISTNVDNLPSYSEDNNINSPNKDERNINISSIQKAPSENPKIEKKPSKESSEHIDYARLLEFFNKCMQGKAINPIKAITDRRKQHIATRAREFGKNAIMTVIEKAAASDYLNGYHGGRAWKADFDWLFLPTKFPKILEGYYDNDNFKEHQELSKKSGYVDPMIADGTRLRQDQMDYTKNIW